MAFGGAMQVGYLPDMFGHVAQMPQLLTLFGLDDAVVWRGVPSTLRAPAFTWRSPDGSTVRAEYLPGGYFNGSDMPADPAELDEASSSSPRSRVRSCPTGCCGWPAWTTKCHRSISPGSSPRSTSCTGPTGLGSGSAHSASTLMRSARIGRRCRSWTASFARVLGRTCSWA